MTAQSLIERNGSNRIVLPENMTHDEAITRISADKDLQRYGEQLVTVEETIPRFPFEAAHALAKATEQLHGAAIGHDIPQPDGTIIRNRFIGVPISATETIQVPWGPFHLPDVEGEIETVQDEANGMAVMKLLARVKRKYVNKVKALADKTRELADQESIYRGQAITVKFRDEAGDLEVVPPLFMDLSGDHTVIFSEDVMREVKINVLMPIKRAELARKLNVPAKRGALLVGTYGSGKTLTARWMAKEAVAVGRTFFYLADAFELGDALRLAAQYGPSMIFGEDIDRVMFGMRTKKMDQVLNSVDGVDTKNLDVIIVLTTNNLEMIHPAFTREGRMDTIIHIDKPDVRASEALVRHFGGQLIDAKEKLNRLATNLHGRSPAFIREIVERSKLEKLLDLSDDSDSIEAIQLTAQDLELAFHHHVKEREGIEAGAQEMELMANLVEQLQAHGHAVQVRRRG